jgi:hypothetical protein
MTEDERTLLLELAELAVEGLLEDTPVAADMLRRLIRRIKEAAPQ